MFRPTRSIIAALVLLLPLAATAQSSTERDKEREAERVQRLREQRDAAAERARDRAERDRDRKRERDAGSLDTVVTFDARGTVSVSCPGGAVIVNAGTANEVRVRARTESGGIRFTSSSGRATLEPQSGRGCSDGRFEITVPSGVRLTATTWSGSVAVHGVHGEMEVHAQSGDVEIRDAGDRLDVETLSGDVVIAGVKGEATIRTVSGDLEFSGARGTVDIETVSGDIRLRDVIAKQVRTHTTSGDITFQGAVLDAGRYEFNTHNGEIGLELPADIGAELSISTFNGGLESDFPITLKAGEHGIGSAQAKRLNFTVGRGTARIIAETFSGDITLRRRR